MRKKERKTPDTNNRVEYIQNYDAVVKDSFTLFKNKTLSFLGIESDARITEILATEKREIQVDTEFSDLSFLTDKGYGIHIEEETDISRRDLYRFCGYQVDLSQKHGIDFVTVILTFKAAAQKKLETPTLLFCPWIVNLGERDADELLEKIRGKLERGEEINELELVFLPVCRSGKRSVEQLLEEGIKLALGTPSNEKVAALMLMLTNRLVGAEELKRIWEEFKAMTKLKVLEVAEEVGMEKGMEKGMERGMEKGLQKGMERVARIALKKGMPLESIQELTGLSRERIAALSAFD
ncbi:MAG: hypothetical protein LBP19_02880 [Treponema sp.]|jgi:hypothetical protein|nr:hypothetical protein [Treponema sp.]